MTSIDIAMIVSDLQRGEKIPQVKLNGALAQIKAEPKLAKFVRLPFLNGMEVEKRAAKIVDMLLFALAVEDVQNGHNGLAEGHTIYDW